MSCIAAWAGVCATDPGERVGDTVRLAPAMRRQRRLEGSRRDCRAVSGWPVAMQTQIRAPSARVERCCPAAARRLPAAGGRLLPRPPRDERRAHRETAADGAASRSDATCGPTGFDGRGRGPGRPRCRSTAAGGGLPASRRAGSGRSRRQGRHRPCRDGSAGVSSSEPIETRAPKASSSSISGGIDTITGGPQPARLGERSIGRVSTRW